MLTSGYAGIAEGVVDMIAGAGRRAALSTSGVLGPGPLTGFEMSCGTRLVTVGVSPFWVGYLCPAIGTGFRVSVVASLGSSMFGARGFSLGSHPVRIHARV